MTEFKDFDRALVDLRDAIATANLDRSNGVKRYVAMLDALDVFFALYFGDLPPEEREPIWDAFVKLAKTVDTFVEDKTSNVTPLKPTK